MLWLWRKKFETFTWWFWSFWYFFLFYANIFGKYHAVFMSPVTCKCFSKTPDSSLLSWRRLCSFLLCWIVHFNHHPPLAASCTRCHNRCQMYLLDATTQQKNGRLECKTCQLWLCGKKNVGHDHILQVVLLPPDFLVETELYFSSLKTHQCTRHNSSWSSDNCRFLDVLATYVAKRARSSRSSTKSSWRARFTSLPFSFRRLEHAPMIEPHLRRRKSPIREDNKCQIPKCHRSSEAYLPSWKCQPRANQKPPYTVGGPLQ